MKDLITNYRQHKMLYWMILPVILFFIVFNYVPMAGIIMAFQDYSPQAGIFGSKWIGLNNFIEFFKSPNFIRVTKNTLLLSFWDLLFNFPAPIILALLLNEIHGKFYKKVVQTISYLPYFLSIAIVCGLIRDFTAANGPITIALASIIGKKGTLLGMPDMFRPIFISTNIWQTMGYGSIIYLAALSQVDEEQYEAATIDGAGHWKQCLYVTIPGIASTIIIMLILRIGQLLSVNFEKVLLLYNSAVYETADVISTYIYRQGILNHDYGYSTAVGLFNSVIGMILILGANNISRKYSETSLF
ncbi:ABC transporter permease [Anaerocolumna sp. MB42-C2]|uniref:ABC transporter permease n=1 Tax=Anaerocolumna sp. MB42-C2 TaxID=3070997 RepID=UPI0027E0396D|nr:ABC transporter permease subunit [Anaerocolumna sp. MB42-C2]WMJ90131.1 ABC transporter permease subunit [Anaerocolumna sp. MB42-C2]